MTKKKLARQWYDISPADADGLNLLFDTDITGPLGEDGTVCPWPWLPQTLIPLGMYRCAFCGSQTMAGVPHMDYRGFAAAVDEAMAEAGVSMDGGDGLV